MTYRRGCYAAFVVAVTLAMLGAGMPVHGAAARSPNPMTACPVPVADVPPTGAIVVCVDRGSGSTYIEGEPITIGVTASIPQLAIFPPPPPPTIRLTRVVDGQSQGVIFEEDFTRGERSITRTIAPPLGQETIRAEAINDRGQVFLTDTVTFRTARVAQQPPSPPPGMMSYIEAALDLSAPCIPETGLMDCDPVRRSLWNGEAAAWSARGVTDPDIRFVETVMLRVGAGDPAAIGAIATALGWPYLKVTLVRFAQDELVEITNLGGGAQDLSGWTIRSPARDVEVALLAGHLLQPGERCFVHTGPARADPADRCYVIAPMPAEHPDGLWPDSAGAVVLFAGPLGVVADQTFYRADVQNQPPPPNLQGTTAVVAGSPAGG
jgi:hypothetical protein